MTAAASTPEILTDESRSKLRSVSTATLTTALYKHGLRNTFLALSPLGRRHSAGDANMVGEAYTLRFIPSREDVDRLEVLADREHPQRKAIEAVPPGQVLVVDSRGDASAASLGDILVARLAYRGVEGCVTDGGMRDSSAIKAFDFPSYHQRPSAPMSLIRHHAVDLNVPIGCAGVAVYPGDIAVGDDEGVVIIPAHLANVVATQSHEQTLYEDFVAERVAAGESIFGLYPATDASREAFSKWLLQRGLDA